MCNRAAPDYCTPLSRSFDLLGRRPRRWRVQRWLAHRRPLGGRDCRGRGCDLTAGGLQLGPHLPHSLCGPLQRRLGGGQLLGLSA